MKKQYINPEILTTSMQATMIVCGSKEVKSVSGSDLNYVGGGNGAARTKEYNDWDDDDWE